MIHYDGNEKMNCKTKATVKKSKFLNNYKTLYKNISKLSILSNPYPILDCKLSFFDYPYSNRNPKYLELWKNYNYQASRTLLYARFKSQYPKTCQFHLWNM